MSALAAYFPFSKLMHMAGVFLSPTRNLANNNRMVRHVNPVELSGEEAHLRRMGRRVPRQIRSRRDPYGDSLMSEPLIQIEQNRIAGDWTAIKPEFRKGTYCHSAPAKNLKYLGLPNPREWQPFDQDWKLPADWKQIILDGIKERLGRFRSLPAVHGYLCALRGLRR